MLYKARNEAIKFYDEYPLMMYEAKYRATKVTGLKYQHLNKWFNDYQ